MQSRLFLVLVALVVCVSFLMSGADGLGITLAVAALAVASIVTANRSSVSPPIDAEFSTRLNREVANGNRLALYDQDTGLLSNWYFSMRFSEECDRASRYGGSFSVILLDADRTVEEKEDRLLDWMRRNKRSTDPVGCYSAGHYLMMLPNTDRVGAELALRRLQRDVFVSGSIAEFPHDGVTPQELQLAAASRLAGVQRAA